MQLKNIKKIGCIIFIFALISCNKKQDNYLIIEGKSVGSFIIEKKLNQIYNKDELIIDIKRDSIIKNITILSDKYYTTKNISINMHKDIIIKKYGKPLSDGIYLKKGNVNIGKAFDGYIYEKIIFITENDTIKKIMIK